MNVYSAAKLPARPASVKVAFLRRLLPYVIDIGPPWLRRKILELIPHKGLQELKAIVDTMHRRSVEIFEQKKRALEKGDEIVTQQVGEGKDIMSILCEQSSSIFVPYVHD